MGDDPNAYVDVDFDGTTSQTRRFGRLALGATLLAGFVAGVMVRSWTAKREADDYRKQFPILLTYATPLQIRMKWHPELVHSSPDQELYFYEGAATYEFSNRGDQPIKIAFPPQSCFHFSLHECEPRTTESIPSWAREKFVVTLQPGASRSFEGTRSATTTGSDAMDTTASPGDLAFDFAAPEDSQPGEFVTGTVFSWKQAVAKSQQAN
ncbi:MAG: hypothetical protein K1X57_21510 [Gemmataceae bacterium]|nr:hypothetical protein [Gemmataceae bacterium]